MIILLFLLVCATQLHSMDNDTDTHNTFVAQEIQRYRPDDNIPLTLAKQVFPLDKMITPSSTSLEGHTDPVYSAKFSPDGTKIVTGSGDGTARVWNTNSGQQINTLKGHDSYLLSANFSPDGTKIVTRSDDRTARVWNANSGQHIQTLKGHDGYLLSANFSPDGTKIVTGACDKTARVWDLRWYARFLPMHQPRKPYPMSAASKKRAVCILAGLHQALDPEKNYTYTPTASEHLVLKKWIIPGLAENQRKQLQHCDRINIDWKKLNDAPKDTSQKDDGWGCSIQ